jgi:hypothetical protein
VPYRIHAQRLQKRHLMLKVFCDAQAKTSRMLS